MENENKNQTTPSGCLISVVSTVIVFVIATFSGGVEFVFFWLGFLANVAILFALWRNIVAKNTVWVARLIPITLLVLSFSVLIGAIAYSSFNRIDRESYALRQELLDIQIASSGVMIFSLIAALIVFAITAYIQANKEQEIKVDIIECLKTVYQSDFSSSNMASELGLDLSRISDMTEKYKDAVRKFIVHLDASENRWHEKRFSKIDTEVFPSWNNSIQDIFEFLTPSVLSPAHNVDGLKYLRQLMLHDGFLPKPTSSDGYDRHAYIHKYVSLFGTTLRKQILESNEWSDSKSVDLAVYLIVRKVVIDHYAEKYVNEYGYGTLEQFCQTQDKFNFKYETAHLFTYYHIQKTDLSYSITQTYKRILNKGVLLIEQNKKMDFEQEMFPQKPKDDEKKAEEREYIKNKIRSLKENENKILRLARKYERSFHNYLDKCGDIELDFFALFSFMFEQVYHENSVKGKILRHFFTKDEMAFDANAQNEYVGDLRQFTEALINGLRQRLIQNGEWEDEDTFEAALFLILRANVIKHGRDQYMSDVGCRSLEELYINKKCSELPTGFTLYHIYETNIFLPISKTHRSLYKQYNSICEKMRTKEIENELFEADPAVSCAEQETNTDK